MGFPPYDEDPQQLASSCLGDTPDSPDSRAKQRQLLALLAVDLIQRFREEEARLLHKKSPALSRCRQENRRMARQLRTLITYSDLGLAIQPGLQALLEAWRLHQQRTWSFENRQHPDWGVTS